MEDWIVVLARSTLWKGRRIYIAVALYRTEGLRSGRLGRLEENVNGDFGVALVGR